MLLNFSDRTRTGVFNMIWPLSRRGANVALLEQREAQTVAFEMAADLAKTQGRRSSPRDGSSSMGKQQQNDNSTWCSQAVTHPSTNQAQCCLTSVIGRELVFSTWYGRCQEVY